MQDNSIKLAQGLRYAGLPTFCRLPYAPDAKGLQVAVVGLPFDAGSTYRAGARFAPRAVREASALLTPFSCWQEADLVDVKAADIGDLDLPLNSVEVAYERVSAKLLSLQSSGTRVVAVGGDHSLLLPALRAARAAHGDLCLIHFDSHTDTGDSAYEERYHHGTPVRRALEESLLDGTDIFQIGIRGPMWTPAQRAYVRENGMRVLEMRDFMVGPRREHFFEKMRKRIGTRPCYVTFDVDVLDPAFAPAAGTPVMGGMSTFQALEALGSLRGLNVVGADVVEITPAYDVSQLTAQAGAAILFELICLASGAVSHGPSQQEELWRGPSLIGELLKTHFPSEVSNDSDELVPV